MATRDELRRSNPPALPRGRVAVPVGATLVGIVLAYVLIAYLWPLALTLVVAGAAYYVFAPLVSALERRRVPRTASAVVIFALLVAALVLAGVTLVPRAYAEVTDLAASIPERAEEAERWLSDRGLAGGEDTRLREAVDNLVAGADSVALGAAEQALDTAGRVLGSIFAVLFGLILGFYLLVDAPRLAASAAGWFPPGARDRWTRFGAQASAVLDGYLRARILASLFVGVAYTISFLVLGLPGAVALGLVGGVLNVVPVVGPVLAALPALAVAVFEGLPTVAVVLIVMVVAQQVESAVVNPHLEARYVRMPPAAIVFAAAAGAALAGIPGILLAVPLAGLARAALDVFYRESWSLPADAG